LNYEQQTRKEPGMKVTKKELKCSSSLRESGEFYDHYIALDWSLDNVTVARMRPGSTVPKTLKMVPDVKLIKDYAQKCYGRKILCIEETTGSHWLYVELKDYFDKIIICDPYRNHLLQEGAKSDKIDAVKLCQLLRAGLLKEVYHSLDADYHLRKIVSSYEDWIQFGVRFKNRKSALYRSVGLRYKKDNIDEGEELLKFIETQQESAIALYEERRREYEHLFRDLRKKNPLISSLTAISGINDKWAVSIYSKVIDASRFETKYKYWSYCGLAKHEKESGGRSYGKRDPRYCRRLKYIYKSAALAAIGGNNDIRCYYEHLLSQGISPGIGRKMVARYIAKVSYAMLKHKSEYIPYQWRKGHESEPIDRT
jgi:transposase